ARPPTIDAAAVACTYWAQVESPPHTATTTKTRLTPASSDVARRLATASCRRRACSDPTGGPTGASGEIAVGGSSVTRQFLQRWAPGDGRPSPGELRERPPDRKSTRLNSSHSQISYAVF